MQAAQPDWGILRSAGVMPPTALKEAVQVGVPRDKMVGNAPACAEQDMTLAGEVARHAAGTDFPLIQDILKYVYAKGKGPGPPREGGTTFWTRGMLRAWRTTEAIRTARRHFGNQPLTGAQVQWGCEHLTITPASLKEWGAEGLLPPLALSCHDHEGGGREVPAVERHTVDGAHRLDRHRSGPGAAPGGGVSGQVCAGEGHHAADLPVGLGMHAPGGIPAPLRTE